MLDREYIFEAMRNARLLSLVSRGTPFGLSRKGGVRPNVTTGGSETAAQFITRITNVVAEEQDDPVLEGLALTEAEYEALTYYENRTYTLDNGAVYNRATLITPPMDVFNVSDIHVKITGNDTTGNGSEANPYLTLSRAWDVAPLAGGITIWMHGGTFVENVGAIGYFNKTGKSFVSPLKIKGVQGATTIITAASGNRVINITGTVTNVVFQNIRIQALASTLYGAELTTHTGVEFRDCTILDDAGGSLNSLRSVGTGTNFKVKRCTITCGGAGTWTIGVNSSNLSIIGNVITSRNVAIGMGSGHSGSININNNLINNTTGDTISVSAITVAGTVLNMKRNIINSTADGIFIVGGNSTNALEIHIDYNVIDCTGEGIVVRDYINAGSIKGNDVTSAGLIGIAAPDDGHSTTTFSTRNLDISYNSIVCTGANGHAFLIGTVSDHNTVAYNLIDARNGGEYAIVGKGSTHTYNNNLLYGGGDSSMLLKACDTCQVTENCFYQEGTGASIRFTDTPVEPFDNVVTDNFAIAVEVGANIYSIPGGEMGTGNLVDRNKFYLDGAAEWGLVLTTPPDPTTIAEVRAKWAASYPSAPSNDQNSIVLTSI